MTIAVTVENTDQTKTIEVVEKSLDRDSGLYSFGSPFALGPGAKRTFYCYVLRDLIIREQHFDPHH
jgi:hypothetical protein